MEWYKGRTVVPGTRVFVYYNLHKQMFSVKALDGEYVGKVVLHAPVVCLNDCLFYVSPTGQARVRKEKRKNVHAGVVGSLLLEDTHMQGTEVIYNPYKYDTFIYSEDATPIKQAKQARLINKRVFVNT